MKALDEPSHFYRGFIEPERLLPVALCELYKKADKLAYLPGGLNAALFRMRNSVEQCIKRRQPIRMSNFDVR
jgi:hypothetical protein